MKNQKSEGISEETNLENGTWSVLQTGEALIPYTSQLSEHVRYENTCTIGERTNTKIIEGPVEDVLKIINAINVKSDLA